jgi:hypothetical protein
MTALIAEKRLPNYIVMSMGEDHTRGTTPGAYTPQAMVANNDYAILYGPFDGTITRTAPDEPV